MTGVLFRALGMVALLAATMLPALAQPVSLDGVAVYNAGDEGVTPPKVLRHPQPEYTESARNAQRQGKVVRAFVVGTDGRAHDIVVTKRLDPGLDRQAVESVRQYWRFSPGRRNGKPVAVRGSVEISFRLR